MDPDEVLYEARARLTGAGLGVGGDGDVLTLTWGGVTRLMQVEYIPVLTLSAVESHLGFEPQSTLFVSEYVNPKTADGLRRRGVQFVDVGGNMSLTNDHWLINIQGRKSAPRTRPDRYASENMFSPRRAQVIFALLTWPELIDAPLRDVSAASGVSLGLAHSAFFELKENHRMWPAHAEGRERLIDAWAAAFPSGLAPSLVVRKFRAERLDMFFGDNIEVSGDAAQSSGLRPTRPILYVETLDDGLVVSNRWRSDGPHNLTVRRKFWHEPAGHHTHGVTDAPPLIVYGDLVSSDDPRHREAAAALRRKL